MWEHALLWESYDIYTLAIATTIEANANCQPPLVKLHAGSAYCQGLAEAFFMGTFIRQWRSTWQL